MKNIKVIQVIDDTFFLKSKNSKISLTNSQSFKYGKILSLDKAYNDVEKLFAENSIAISIVGEDVLAIINQTYSESDRTILSAFLERLGFSKIIYELEEDSIPSSYNLIIIHNHTSTILIDRTTQNFFTIDHDLYLEELEVCIINYVKRQENIDNIFIYGINHDLINFAKYLEKNTHKKVYYPNNYDAYPLLIK